jgi:hypothetical protein
MRYSVLNNFHQRRRFDPTNTEDLAELKFFLEHNHWRNACPFYAEYPWEDIPAMCYYKYTERMLSHLKVTTQKQKSPE